MTRASLRDGGAPRARRSSPSSLRLRLVLLSLLAAVSCSTALAGCETLGSRARGPVGSAALVLEPLWATGLTGDLAFWEFADTQRGGVALTPGGLLVLGLHDGRVVGVDEASGEVLWTFRPASVPLAVAAPRPAEGDEPAAEPELSGESEPINARPVFSGGVVYVGSSDGRLYALKPSSGELLWQFDTGGAIEAAAAAADGTVVVANTLNRVFALDARSGAFRWRQERPKPTDYTMLGHTAPVVRDGVVYVGYSDGQLMAYTLADGKLVWGRDLSAGAARFPDVDATPLVADGTMFASSFAGGLYRLDPAANEVVWRRDDLEGASEVTLVDGGLAYFSSRSGVHAIDAETGETLWHYPISGDLVTSAPVVGQRHVYVSMKKRGLLVLERSTGLLVTLVNPGNGMTSRPRLVPGRLIGLSNGGVLYSWRVDDGPLGESPPRLEAAPRR